MQTFYQPLYGYGEFKELQDAVKKKKLPVQVTGCIDSQKCHLHLYLPLIPHLDKFCFQFRYIDCIRTPNLYAVFFQVVEGQHFIHPAIDGCDHCYGFPFHQSAQYPDSLPNVRVELWGDEVDSIRSFDSASQRSIENLEEIRIYPASEFVLEQAVKEKGLAALEAELKEFAAKLRAERKNEEAARIGKAVAEFKENLEYCQGSVGLDSYVNYFFTKTVSFFDYFCDGESAIFLDEPARIMEKGQTVMTEFSESMTGRIEKGYILPGQMDVIFDYRALLAGIMGATMVFMHNIIPDIQVGKT